MTLYQITFWHNTCIVVENIASNATIPIYNNIDNDDYCSSYGTNHVEDVVFKANAARDDAESWLCQIADGEL